MKTAPNDQAFVMRGGDYNRMELLLQAPFGESLGTTGMNRIYVSTVPVTSPKLWETVYTRLVRF